MISAMRKRTHLGEQWWREVISKQPASGLSIAAYCRQRRVPEASFFARRRKLRDTAHFAEVRIAPEPGAESSGIELRLSHGRSVLVRAGFDRHTLLELLATLEANPCQLAPNASTTHSGSPTAPLTKSSNRVQSLRFLSRFHGRRR